MTNWRWRALLILVPFVAAALARPPARTPSKPADTVVVNGKIYALDPRQPWAEALAIADGAIVFVGSTAGIAPYRGPNTNVIDAGGRLVLPGFTDSHIHFLEGSLDLGHVDLSGTHSIREIQDRLKKYAAEHPGNGWILGQGWSYEVFGAAALPDKRFIDEVIRERPVFLEAFDTHTTWANSKALELAGIRRDTPDPKNGKIVRDPKTGEATGALKEDAGELVRRVLPQPSREEKLAAIRAGLKEASRAGLVRVHSARGDFESLDLYDALRREGELSLRMHIAYVVEPPELTRAKIDTIEQARQRYHDDWLSAGVVKFFLDGVVETHTAAMLEPYSDDPSLRGTTFWDPQKYKQAVAELDRRGFQMFTHAIGDRSVRLALDAYEEAHRVNGTRDARDRIEHIETISKDDIPRFGRLGVIASMQPLDAYPILDNDVWSRNAGPERETRGFAWHSIAAAGGRLAFGSDWPVVTLSPWPGIQTAVTRQTNDGQPPGGWLPEQRVTLPEAIEAYTLGAAFAGRREKTEGSLEPGKVADLIILSQNLFEIDAHKISKTEVLLTMVGGRIVYQGPGWSAKTETHGQAAKP